MQRTKGRHPASGKKRYSTADGEGTDKKWTDHLLQRSTTQEHRLWERHLKYPRRKQITLSQTAKNEDDGEEELEAQELDNQTTMYVQG